ncbi:cytochrome P450 [Umezawaea sp. Da 62-37]|uniref:cytochrome P450 family protein n=1 Tax=Umezawaea sp. Da 62-37 TaxID=3075927 RepID=UPI0028F73F6E|nr:cytochrome P450 [Umezawaea sp. Da 62-37]WNV88969.1 cytochrome P450 [Umezawaea sp. Da 62-37]
MMPASPPEPVVDLTDPAVLADPLRGYDRILAETPVCRARLPGGGEAWLITGNADVRAVLAHPAIRNDPAGLPGHGARAQERTLLALGTPEEHLPYLRASLLSLDGAAHTRLRRSIAGAFGAAKVAEMRPRLRRIVHDLLDTLGGTVDLLDGFAYPVAMTVVCELVGVDEEDRDAWRRWGKVLVAADPAEVAVTMGEMFASCHALVDRRRADPKDDLISAVVAQDHLGDVEAVALVVFLVLAGHETAAHALSNAALALMRDRAQLDLLLADPELWPAAVRELVRTHGPVQLARLRYAAEDITVGGVLISAGDAVQVVLGAANRDPDQFTHPHEPDIRWQAGQGYAEGHVGFGWGPHFCLGAALARVEGEESLRALFERFPDVHPVGEPAWVPLPRGRHREALDVRLT